MTDLNFQNISTAQNRLQPGPRTIAGAATITPTTFLTIVTGTTSIATITPPITGSHLLAIVVAVTNYAGFLTTGNILVASITNSTVWANKLNLFAFNPLTQKYHPLYATAETNS